MIVTVYWLECSQADVPAGDDWLNASEALRQSSLGFVRRRADWRLGRWTAKHAVAACLNLPGEPEALQKIEIHVARDGAPEVILSNRPAAVSISLSHRAGFAICAISLAGGALGCDLEMTEPHSREFAADYFTTEEQVFVGGVSEPDRSRLLSLLWSAKESALKALRMGLRVDTRQLAVTLEDADSLGFDTWFPLHVRYSSERIFHGWWQRSGELLRTLVADPPPDRPVRLKIGVPVITGPPAVFRQHG